MATHDYVLANQSGSSFRTDLNNALAAIVSGNSSGSEPSTTYAYMIWNDSGNGLRKIRNSANNAWITLSTLTGGNVFDDDVTFNGASYNLVWDKSDNALEFADNAKCTFGAGDLEVFHDGNNSIISDEGTGNLKLQTNGANIQLNKGTTENMIVARTDGAVELYFDNVKTFSTNDSGIIVQGPEGGSAFVYMYADEGDDNADKYWLKTEQDGTGFLIQNYVSGSTETNLRALGNGAVELFHNNVRTFYTDSYGVVIAAPEGGAAELQIWGDEGDDNNDKFMIDAFDGQFRIKNYTSGSWETNIECNGNNNVELYYDNAKVFETLEYGARIKRPSGGSTDLEVIGCEGQDAYIHLWADDGDDDEDKWRLASSGNGNFYLQNYAGSAWESNIVCGGNGAVEIYYDGSQKITSLSTGIAATGRIQYNSSAGSFTSFRESFKSGAVSNGGTFTAQTHNCHACGTVTITSNLDGSSNNKKCMQFPISLNSTSNANLGSALFEIDGSSGQNFSVAGASKGVTVTNTSGNTIYISVTYDITGSC